VRLAVDVRLFRCFVETDRYLSFSERLICSCGCYETKRQSARASGLEHVRARARVGRGDRVIRILRLRGHASSPIHVDTGRDRRAQVTVRNHAPSTRAESA